MKYILLFFGLLFLFSCKKNQENTIVDEQEQSLKSIVQKYDNPLTVKSNFKNEVENWKEYRTLDKFIERFKTASANEVLSNALELESLVKNLKDSVKPVLFDIPSFNTRVNILHNETLRLSDITTIPSIKADEINRQTKKIIAAYAAMNAKINTILSKKAFEDAITIDAVFIGLDTTKIDSISKKAIKKNNRERDSLIELQSKT